jgi:hypothetical protein
MFPLASSLMSEEVTIFNGKTIPSNTLFKSTSSTYNNLLNTT